MTKEKFLETHRYSPESYLNTGEKLKYSFMMASNEAEELKKDIADGKNRKEKHGTDI